MVKIFISHSAKDSTTAEALAELLHSSLRLSKSDIRCTSVDGYRLPAGANTDEQLRREVLDCPVLIGLISHHSFESAYVLFELGARWGKNAYLAPVLVSGVSTDILKGPLSGLNALSCKSASQVHQIVHDVAEQLKIPIEPAATYQKLVDTLIAIPPVSQHNSSTISSQEKKDTQIISNSEDQFPDADDIIRKHCESQWADDYSMLAYCQDQQYSALEELRTQTYDDIPIEVFQRIRSKSAKEWPEDFEMRLYTEKEQIEAYRKLKRKK